MVTARALCLLFSPSWLTRLRAAVRKIGVKSLDKVDSVVLETDGTFSVVWQVEDGTMSSLVDVPQQPD